ncbi:mitochondrial fission regulator 1-like isoform X2 [Frankliniella occidentalis]|uniref:Mitochondrial fission regulator 1-like isoform X2 n=1 Tax=Frankliniella occidentalis TaxID=133901 RepID=A0A6J1SU71_FRAOC|nr:mitochondrial fission regulator 1-like isoform X2 [Frankliniella occidentalis]
MTDDSNYYFSSVGKLLQRRAKKTKLFWLSCVPSRKHLKKSLSTVRDGQTQTTPTFHKAFSAGTIIRAAEELQVSPESCVVDSSRNILDSDSDVFMASFDSFDNPEEVREMTNSIGRTQSNGNCHCLERDELCKWRQQESAIMDKLSDLQLEINQLRATVSSLKSDVALKSDQSLFSVPPPPPPMPPPPPPPFPSPVFHHSMSLTLPRRRQSVPKMHSDEMMQDRGKPIITLEELQNVKLRHVSSVANIC